MIRRALHHALYFIYKFSPEIVALSVANVVAVIRGKSIRFRKLSRTLYEANDTGIRLHFPDLARGLLFWSNGFTSRSDQLHADYLTWDLHPNPGDIVIDIGSNYGDFYFRWRDSELRYIAFEPSPRVFRCLRQNLGNQTALELAVGASNGAVNFFLEDGTGDSSVIEPHGSKGEKISVMQTRLDDVPQVAASKEIFLVKIEAEGYEPEVIDGAPETLRKTKWVTVDGGPERGFLNATTIDQVTNRLLEAGFSLERINNGTRPGVALFRNLRFL